MQFLVTKMMYSCAIFDRRECSLDEAAKLCEFKDIGLNYVRTLAEWRHNFKVNVSSLFEKGFSKGFVGCGNIILLIAKRDLKKTY